MEKLCSPDGSVPSIDTSPRQSRRRDHPLLRSYVNPCNSPRRVSTLPKSAIFCPIFLFFAFDLTTRSYTYNSGFCRPFCAIFQKGVEASQKRNRSPNRSRKKTETKGKKTMSQVQTGPHMNAFHQDQIMPKEMIHRGKLGRDPSMDGKRRPIRASHPRGLCGLWAGILSCSFAVADRRSHLRSLSQLQLVPPPRDADNSPLRSALNLGHSDSRLFAV
jgi:hypothetical protein